MIKTETTAIIIAIGHVIILIGIYVIVARFTAVCFFDPLTDEWINELLQRVLRQEQGVCRHLQGDHCWDFSSWHLYWQR